MMKLDADIISKLYPKVVSTKTFPNGKRESYDSDGKVVDVDFEKVNKEYDALQYQRDRKLEYPSIEELVVALYDEEDKTSIIERRKAVKAKYPKPE